MNDPVVEKRTLRESIKLQVQNADPESACSTAIESFLGSRLYDESRFILAFASFKGEPDTGPLLAAALRDGKSLALPRVDHRELVFHRIDTLEYEQQSGPFGIREPAPSLPILEYPRIIRADLVIVVPGLAWDRNGNRLGRGGGFYDRFLARVRPQSGADQGKPVTISFCLDLQIVPKVPVESWDRPIDLLITPSETVNAYFTRSLDAE